MSIVLRPAALVDLPQIVALDQEIFGSYGAEESPTVIEARLTVFPEGCVVLEDQPLDSELTIVGYLTTEKWAEAREPALDEDPYQTHQPNGTVLNITTLAIAPAAQNQRLGSRLVEQAIQIAQNEGCRQIILETAYAKRFYIQHDFELVGERVERGIQLFILQYDLS